MMVTEEEASHIRDAEVTEPAVSDLAYPPTAHTTPVIYDHDLELSTTPSIPHSCYYASSSSSSKSSSTIQASKMTTTSSDRSSSNSSNSTITNDKRDSSIGRSSNKSSSENSGRRISSTGSTGSAESNSSANSWVRGPGFWRCYIGLCIPLLLSAFEGSVVSTALPTISQDLTLGANSTWVATAFLLASTVCQPVYGQLADIWGRRHPMMVAVVIFGVGSAVSGCATRGTYLILGRITQGMGTGGIDLFAELILCDIIPLKKRGCYVAIKSAFYAAGTTVGPVMGGVFAQTNWRWCFWINIPVCCVAFVMMFFWLNVTKPESKRKPTLATQLRRLDCVGIGLLAMSVILLLYALSSGGTSYTWTAPPVLVPLVTGALGMFAFAAWERTPYCVNPIMPPRVFSNRTTVAAFIITVAHGFQTYGVQFYLPPFFQSVLGASPTASGVLILPCTLTIVLLAALGGPLLSMFGKYRLMHQAGFSLMMLGFLLCTLLSGLRGSEPWIGFSFIVGIGSGIVVSTTLPTVLVELTDKENAAATGSWAFLRGLGSLFGVAAPGAAFNARFAALLDRITDPAARAQLDNGQAYQRASASFVGSFGPVVEQQIKEVFAESLKYAWILFLILSTLGMLATFIERQVQLRRELASDFGLERDSDTNSSRPSVHLESGRLE